MLFNSFEFALFLPSTFILYWFVFNKNLKARNVYLLSISYIFYGWWDWRFLSLIVFSSTVDYFAGQQIYKSQSIQRKRLFLWISVGTNLGILMFFKYFNFFAGSFADLVALFGLQTNPYTLSIVLPVGVSFYTFQTMSYTIDVYKGKTEASSDPVSFFAFVSFFPQLVAGPIERAKNLLPQFQVSKEFLYKNGTDGIKLIAWGLFKKVAIADNCAVIVNQVFTNYNAATGLELVLGAVFFAFQIYCDFSGYSDMAIGTAKLFGFDLMINFKTPYFSRDVAEFWRRWHVSLSTWFRDYLYIPLGGSKVKRNKVIFNVFVIFIVSGFWHGANWTFIVWGGLNAMYFLPLLLLEKNRKNTNVVAADTSLPSVKEFYQMALTFVLTCIAWVFFRAESVGDAVNYLASIVNANNWSIINISVPEFLPVMVAFWIVLDWMGRKEGVPEMLANINYKSVRYSIYYMIALFIWFFGVFEKANFIYFQF